MGYVNLDKSSLADQQRLELQNKKSKLIVFLL